MVAVDAGVDALGLVFYPASPRYVDLDMAARIVRNVPVFVSVVALFVDAPVDAVKTVIDRLNPDVLQFHGVEEPAYCRCFGRPYIKALRVQEHLSLLEMARHYQSARGLLLDSYRPGVPGGTGETFNWDLIPRSLRGDIVLAGGLTPANVSDAIRQVHPYAVDVSGGVEHSKGIKDAEKIRQFIDRVQAGAGS